MTNPWFFSNDNYNYQHMQYSYNRMEDTSSSFIDPSLQSQTPPSLYPVNMDQHQTMQRQYKEEQKTTMFFNSNMPQQPTFMPPFQARYNSPFSAFEASEASGSAQSPPADTNTELSAYYETRSPLQEPLPFEDTGFSQNQIIQFAGMGLSKDSSFVNPMDVNSTGQLDGYDSETSTPEFTLLQRVDSWESYTTGGVSGGCDVEQMQHHNSPIVDCTKPVNHHYPVPAPQEKVEVQSPTILSLNLKRTRDINADDEDDEYLPTTKRTASLPSTTTAKPRTTTTRRGRPPTSHSSLTTHRPHGPQHLSQPTPRTFSSTATTKAPSQALTPSSARGTLLCPHSLCQHSHSQSHGFKDQPSLDAHIKKQHSRPFICVFSFAGCDSTFGSKNEWKRHVASQHLVLEYWLCREGECAHVDNNSPPTTALGTAGAGPRSGRRSGAGAVQGVMTGEEDDEDSNAPLLPNGAIFNRKDLYTQHVRRMHLPSHLTHLKKESTSTSSNKKPSPLNQSNNNTAQELNTYIATLQSRAQIKRCALPTCMRCPVPSCTHAPFKGTEAWDQRMEHVAKHLEKSAAATASSSLFTTFAASTVSSSPNITEHNGEEDKVEFGGENDKTLTEWASSREVGIIRRVNGGKWTTRDPLKRRGHGGNGNPHGCGVGRGGRTRAVKNKSAKGVKREQEEIYVKQEIVVRQRTFDFDEDLEDE
ncbi:hypothetical protein B0T09DRAFT_77914 [Sordaria sp. MPI-SDFR-AT-0083]|nr:hypothetical protein B0T09DRAFT_77914 [Sordaria sp. MPI-SDFR-AT-0083]